MRTSFMQQRNAMIRQIVEQEVRAYLEAYLEGHTHPKRPCPTDGRMFRPLKVDHFFCSTDCRKLWYKGMFRQHVQVD